MASADRPNVLLVVVDQLRADAVASSGCATPHLDALATDGVRFDRHYTPLGICSPSRASMLTGLYPHANGVWNNLANPASLVRNLPEEHPTLAELLRAEGYRTGYVGKWHLGADRGPGARGFEQVRFCEPLKDPRMVGLAQYLPSVVATRPSGIGAGIGGAHRFPVYFDADVPDDLVPAFAARDEALGLLEGLAAAPAPFFLVASFVEPHAPTILPARYGERYDPAAVDPWPSFGDTFEGKPATHERMLHHYGVAGFTWDDWAPAVARYHGAVTMLDDVVGELLAALEATGRADETVVVFTTDHGDMTGSHGMFNKGPVMYEDVYRIPFVVRAPGAQAGATVDALTSHVDLLPTVLDLAGAPASAAVHGRSLRPFLVEGDADAWRDALLCEFHGDEFGLLSLRGLVTRSHKLVYHPNDTSELYDLDADPWELRNRFHDPEAADVRQELAARLLDAMRATGDGLAPFAVNLLG